ncbi:microtubule-actin cross-linking factor 1-like isoform X7 [Arapaima gigas]
MWPVFYSESTFNSHLHTLMCCTDERDRVQKKTFTKWVNKHLIKVRKHITDLYEDLRDGHNLISLLEVLSGVTLPREKGRMRFHRLQNVQIALDFLKQRQVKLVNIRNDDITDGNPKLTLGLIWTIILHFQMGSSLGCVKQQREAGGAKDPPLSPKKRFRFRRKRRSRQGQQQGAAGWVVDSSLRTVEQEESVQHRGEKSAAITTATTPGLHDSPSVMVAVKCEKSWLDHGSSVTGTAAGNLTGRTLTLPSKLSPECPASQPLKGAQTTEGAPPSEQRDSCVELSAGSTTPGGGRVCRVRERVQGVLQRPRVLRMDRQERPMEEVGGACTDVDSSPETAHRGVVHIREVGGKLCVVRTVYPSEFGSLAWEDRGVEVRAEPPAPHREMGDVFRVKVSDEQEEGLEPRPEVRLPGTISQQMFKPSAVHPGKEEEHKAKEYSLNSSGLVQAAPQGNWDPQSSGYASDVPLTSPDTAGGLQADWEVLASSSSEILESLVLESPLSLSEEPSHLSSQISEIYVSGESGDLTAKEKLLLWSQKATEGYPGLRCTNFSSSWSDGRMFNALLHRYRPDLIDMEVVARQSNRENLEQAFEIAESLGVTRLLDAEDVDVPSPDEKSVITYVSSIYDAFPKIPEGGDGIAAHEVDQRWAEYQSRFSSLLQWTRQHTTLMADKSFPQNPVELKALYNKYVHFKETEIPSKEVEKGRIEHLYKQLEVWIEFGRIKLPQGLHPNDLEEEWGKLILEMLEREKALRPAVERLDLLLHMANKIQNTALACEEKLTLAKNTLQADVALLEDGQQVRSEQELGIYLQDCEDLVRQLQLDLQVLRDEKYYQVDQLAFRVSCLQEELVSLRLQCSSVYRKGHFSRSVMSGDQGGPLQARASLSLALGAQMLLGAAGAVGAVLRQPLSRSQLVAMSSSEDEGNLRFIYELLGWVEETQDLLERTEWGTDLPSVEQHLQEHQSIHRAVEDLLQSLQEARGCEPTISLKFRSSYSETLAKLEHQYCKLLEQSSWRLRCLESLRAFVSRCTTELIWLNEREEEELAFDWSDSNTNVAAKRELYADMRLELEEKQEVMRTLQETADQLCQENHPAKQTVEAYSAALQTQWQWVRQLCLCVEQHLKDNTAYFQFMSDARECESYLRQLQDTIKRQYTCDRNSRLGKLEDLLQDSMEEKEQLIEYRSTVASLVGRAKMVVQLRPRSADSTLHTTAMPIRAICDYRQIEVNYITISKGEECVLEDNSQRTKWKVISPNGNEAMVPSVCFTIPPPNKEAMEMASRIEQLYQNVMSLWHQLHVNMKSVVSWHYLQKDIRTVSTWSLDTMRSQTAEDRQQALNHLDAHLSDFLADSRECALFTAAERRELEKESENCHAHCNALLVSIETVEKDESVSRSYLSELHNIKQHLEEAEQRLKRGLHPPASSSVGFDASDNAIHIAEAERLQQDLGVLRSDLGDVSRRCLSFFEDKPTSSSVPALRSELGLAVEQMDRVHALSSVYLHKLKTVDVLLRSSQAAESLVKKYESRLSEEDIVPADTSTIAALRDQLGRWQAELDDQEHIIKALTAETQRVQEAGAQQSQLHPDRSPELERYQERAFQLAERWGGVRRQIETRQADLEALGLVLQQYREGHSALVRWIEETTEKQENTQSGQTDSRVLSEQLTQQTALVAEIEKNQAKLDECQKYSKQYCASVKDYELQLMTYRAYVESTQKSPVKRRRMHSSSDAITQEFMDLRTRYTALVTLTTQHVKYISDALRRLEEEEKEVEEERQAHVSQVSDLLCWMKGLQERGGTPGGPQAGGSRSVESSLAAQQAISEQLAAKKEEVAEAIRSTQVFLMSKQASKLSPEERAHVAGQLDELKDTYGQLCQSSAAQQQQLQEQLAKEEQLKKQVAIAGVIDLGTVETFPVFRAAQRGLIDQDTCRVLLEAQLVMGGLIVPDSFETFSVQDGLAQGLIDSNIAQSLSELEVALYTVDQLQSREGPFIPVAVAMEEGLIGEDVGLRILELQMSAGGVQESSRQERLSLETAGERGLLTPRVYNKLRSRSQHRELIDPNTAEKLSFAELQQRCVANPESGQSLLPVSQQPGGAVCLRSGRKVGIFRAVQEGLIDRQVTVRLLEAQLFAGGIADPRSGHRLTVNEAVRHGLVDQDLACAILTRQLRSGGLLDPVSGERLDVDEAIRRDLLAPRMALLVLESLWTFMGLLWPESGELLPLTEALQQGVISGELSRRILSQRHNVGALYLPETSCVVPLNQAEEVLEPRVVEVLRETQIPDVLPSMIQSGSPTLNRLSWSSASSSPHSSSPPSSPQGLSFNSAFLEHVGPGEHSQHRLLFHLMTRSYVDAHSGQRLVLLEPELAQLANATSSASEEGPYSKMEPETDLADQPLSDQLTTDKQEPKSKDKVSLSEMEKQGNAEILDTQGESSKFGISGKDFASKEGDGYQGTVFAKTQLCMEKEKLHPTVLSKQKETEKITLPSFYESPAKDEPVSGTLQPKEIKTESMPHKLQGTDRDVQNENIDDKLEIVMSERIPTPVGDVSTVSHISTAQKKLVESKLGETGFRSDDAGSDEASPRDDSSKDILDVGMTQSEIAEVAVGIESSHSDNFARLLMKTTSQPSQMTEVENVKAKESVMKDETKVDTRSRSPDKFHMQNQDAAKEKQIVVSMPVECLVVERKDQAAAVPQVEILVNDTLQEDSSQKSQSVQLEKGEVKKTKLALEVNRMGDNEAKKAVTKQSSQVHREFQQSAHDSKDQIPQPANFKEQRDSMKQNEEDAELRWLVKELQEGGLMTESGERLLLDEALARGVLQGHTAVKLMEQAGLFGGFLDVKACEVLSVEDVVGEGLLDESLMWSVLKSQKTLAGVVDTSCGQLCSLRDAARTGLLDPETVARLLEAQVASGGVVDLRRGKKVSVTLASNLGLIEEGQQQRLAALEKSCRGKSSDSAMACTKIALQLQMDGILDPETRQPITLEKALQKGLLGKEEARDLLSQQVVEGGIMHHGSGIRLSVADALQRGLVDKGMAEELEKLERKCRRSEFSRLDSEASLLQASTGAMFDPVSESRITLTEAVSQGLLDGRTADRAMSSPGVTTGIIDPKSARVVPYSELVSQGKIDIETGQRFLEVKLFDGVMDKRTKQLLTLPQALEARLVDPVPALRLLQSQADSGGIVDIASGERLSLVDAVKKGLIGEDMAKIIVAKKIKGGGQLSPISGELSLREAIDAGLITGEMPLSLQEEDVHDKEDAGTLESKSGTTSLPVLPFNWQIELTKPSDMHATENLLSPEGRPDLLQTSEKSVGRLLPEPSVSADFITHFEPIKSEEEREDLLLDTSSHISVTEKTMNRDVQGSMEVLTQTTINAEKGLQQELSEMKPQYPLSDETVYQFRFGTVDVKSKASPNYIKSVLPSDNASQVSDTKSELQVQLQDASVTLLRDQILEKSEPRDGRGIVEERTSSEVTQSQSLDILDPFVEDRCFRTPKIHGSDICIVTTPSSLEEDEKSGIGVTREEGECLEWTRVGSSEKLETKTSSRFSYMENESTLQQKLETESDKVQVSDEFIDTTRAYQEKGTKSVIVKDKRTSDFSYVDREITAQLSPVLESQKTHDSEGPMDTTPVYLEESRKSWIDDEHASDGCIDATAACLEESTKSVIVEGRDQEKQLEWKRLGEDGKHKVKITPELSYVESKTMMEQATESAGKDVKDSDKCIDLIPTSLEEGWSRIEDDREQKIELEQTTVDKEGKHAWKKTDFSLVYTETVSEQAAAESAIQNIQGSDEAIDAPSAFLEETRKSSTGDDREQEKETEWRRAGRDGKSEMRTIPYVKNGATAQQAMESESEMKQDIAEEEKAEVKHMLTQKTLSPFRGEFAKAMVDESQEENLSLERLERNKLPFGSREVIPKQEDEHFSGIVQTGDDEGQNIKVLESEYITTLEQQQGNESVVDKSNVEKLKISGAEVVKGIVEDEECLIVPEKREKEETIPAQVLEQKDRVDARELEMFDLQRERQEKSESSGVPGPVQKVPQTVGEKQALLLKAKESILRKVFERGVTERQAAKELEALRMGAWRKNEALESPENDQKDLEQLAESYNEETGVRDRSWEEESLSAHSPGPTTFKEDPQREGGVDETKGKAQQDAESTSEMQEMQTLKKKSGLLLLGQYISTDLPMEGEGLLFKRKELQDSDGMSDIWADESSTPCPQGAAHTEQNLPLDTLAKVSKDKNEPGTTFTEKADLDTVAKSGPCPTESVPSVTGETSVSVSLGPVSQFTDTILRRPEDPKSEDDADTEDTGDSQLLKSSESQLSQQDETTESDVGESELEEGEEAEEQETDEEGDERENQEGKSATPVKGSKSSLVRQECLEHDQRIVALLSMVRHIEVRLRQQLQQSSSSPTVTVLNDIIQQAEDLDAELCALEVKVKQEAEAVGQLLQLCPQEVPSQLLVALEKDGRSLSRGYAAARQASQNMLQALRTQRDARKEALNSKLQSLTSRMDELQSWLDCQMPEMQQQVNGSDSAPVQLTRQLQLCEELCCALSARHGDIDSMASCVQTLVSEHAQDLLPEQSRQILRQLQHLQGTFHQATGSAQARAKALAIQQQQEAEKERQREEEERLRAREREVVQQQKAECSQKLESLTKWLAGAASMLASQKTMGESGDISVLQERQRELKEVQQDLQSRGDDVMETVHGVEEFLAEQGDSLNPEERARLQGALSQVREQFGTLTNTAQSSLAQLDTAISTTVQQNTQRAKAVEELQETQGRINNLLEQLSSVPQLQVDSGTAIQTSSSTLSESALHAHQDALQAELLHLQAQQAQLLQVSQGVQSLLEQPDSTVPAEEKQRLRLGLEQLQEQHKERLQGCQERLRRAEVLSDELTKFLQEHGQLGAWLEASEQELHCLGGGETDPQDLGQRLEDHKKLAEDVICHKADLRFVTISGQKVLNSVLGTREQDGSVDPALEETQRLVSERMQEATQRYTALHSKSLDLGARLTGLLDRYQQYQEEVGSLNSWLTTQEQNQSSARSSAEQTDTQTLQNTLRSVQLLQTEMAERSVHLEKVKRTGRELASIQESPTLRASDILHAADTLDGRFGALSELVSQRTERLQTAVAQSVSAQEALSGLQSWLDGLVVEQGPVQPTAQAVHEALAQNQKLRQELLSRQGSVDAMQESVSKLLQTADAMTASGLQGALQAFIQHYAAAQATQAKKEAELRTLLPRLESYDRLNGDLRNFVQGWGRVLNQGGQPDRSVEDYRQTVEEVKLELNQERDRLKPFCELGRDLSQCESLANGQRLLENTTEVSEEFSRLESCVSERLGLSTAIQNCGQQLELFRSLSGTLRRWLQTVQDRLPSEEPSLSTDGLRRRVEQLKELLAEWEAQGSKVQELNQTGAELEALIIRITSPQTKTGVVQINGASSPSSVNGIHTCQDLTEIQVMLADVGRGYEHLGTELQGRLERQTSSLEQRLRAQHQAEELTQWLSERERGIATAPATSPSRPEVVRAQAQENKALLSELSQHSGKVEELKGILQQLITENPDSPEAETWREQLRDIDQRWQNANEKAAQRQQELEACADRLGSFTAAAHQLAPWLQEKELMMSVLGPLSIDPNMLNTQKQQVQIMLREFETRQPQFDQLTKAAQGILSPGGEAAQDQQEVQEQLGAISRQWGDLMACLVQRSQLIDRAQGTSERYQAQLHELSVSLAALSERLDAQALLSTRPEALRRQLQETGEVRAELEQRRQELSRAEELCHELSAIVAEPYLRDELRKRLDGVSAPLHSLEERTADALSQLQAALSSTQQFQQMFDELRSWLDERKVEQAGTRKAGDPLPCQPEALQALLSHQDEAQKALALQRGQYELIQAEGASLLVALPPGGEERSALQTRLGTLRQDWDTLKREMDERHSQLHGALQCAEQYRQQCVELTPWVEECEQREAQIQPSLEATSLEEALQRARQLGLDLERRRPQLEALNVAADQLLERCRTGEEEVLDEKAALNGRVDGLAERLQARTTQLEELMGRLREFEEGRQAVERRLEAARHQIEVQEALGPQACSNKSLERLRNQQEALCSLRSQVTYLRDLARGLVQDAPVTPGGIVEGKQRLEQQAQDTEKEFGDVSEKIEQCCSSLESRLQGVGEVQSRVRDVFSRLTDLDDELDSLGPVGRDADSLASQAEAVRDFLSRLATLRSELEAHGGDCAAMLRREGSSPDLLALRRETEALGRQATKLAERGQARLVQVEEADGRICEFYTRLSELQELLGKAEEGLSTQGAVATEVELIKQQLQDFKAVEREQVEAIQPRLQQVNAVGQGLIQSAAKDTDTRALEHDLDTTNLRWNSLNKRLAERIAQLQEALLHCGKFQDALEPLLSWLSDTEDLITNQKPPSAEYRVVKAQIQEQKLLQRLLDDRRGTVEMIRAEGQRIAATAEPQDQDKIQRQLESLGDRWSELLDKASARQRQLEELQVLALQFHEAVEPLGEWLSTTERRLSTAEPMGTQAAKITQQIARHKALHEEVVSQCTEVQRLEAISQSLWPLSCAADRDWMGERVGALRGGHAELSERCSRRAVMLEQALANAQLFGEEEVEVLNWLAEVAQRLTEVSVQSYKPEQLSEQHKHTLSLNEEILSRKKTVDQAIKNGQALLKQTTGSEEVLLIQEKLDGIKSRYAEITASSSKALRTLEQALQLATRFASAHDDLNQWLDSMEAELSNTESDTTPAYQERQKELKCVSAEKRLVLDTVNEVGSALLDLVPWRAREGLDRLVADANQRYRQADETIMQRVQLVQAAIKRSQQYEEAVDAELAWVSETERKLSSLGPLSLEPDVTVAQMQVQRAFNIDIIRHRDAVDQLLNSRSEILESCTEQQREALKVKTDLLSTRYEAVSHGNSERFSALEQAQVLVARFWETHEELEPWLGEMEALITQLPPPAIDTETLRLQQDQMRLLRESIAEHKPHIDKLLKISPQLAELSAEQGTIVRQRCSDAERRYLTIKEEVKGRATALDEAVSQSTQFHDKMDPLLETLEGVVQRLRQPPPVAAEVEKIREQLAEHRASMLELDKLLPSFSTLCTRGEELITRAPQEDPAAQAARSRLLRLRSLWDEIHQRAEEREGKLQDVLDLAGKFWADMAALLSTLRDSQEIVKDLEDPGVDPSLIKQQTEAAEAIKGETDGLREELEFVRTLGADLIFACGETEKPEVKKTIDEMNAAWDSLNRTWRERMERLDEAMTASVQYQDALQGMFDYLDNAVIKLCDMPTVGTDLGTVKQQIEELKQFKVEVYQQQIDMEKLCHQGELLLKKVTDQTDRDMIQEPLTELRHLWDNLGDKITHRQHKLEGALLALGQFQHALSELQSWLSHTHTTLETQRPVSSDPKAIEIELAKHNVLKNDVLSHRSTVDTVNSAGSELLESGPGDEASHLREQLDELNRSWESLLLKTQERQKMLEAALQQAEGFHGELEEFLQWMRRTESQLSAAKPTGGLPETAREQLQQHMELQAQLDHRADQYHRLVDQGESMLLSRRGDESTSPGTTQTQQNLALLQNKWASLNTKMDDRRPPHTHSRGYAKPWLAHSKTPPAAKCQPCPEPSLSQGPEGAANSKLKRPTFHSSRGSLTGENGAQAIPSAAKPTRPDTKRTPSSASGPTSRAGSQAGSRASSRRGSDASDTSELLETRSACSDTSDTPRRPGAKPSKIPTISKKTPSPKTPTGKR